MDTSSNDRHAGKTRRKSIHTSLDHSLYIFPNFLILFILNEPMGGRFDDIVTEGYWIEHKNGNPGVAAILEECVVPINLRTRQMEHYSIEPRFWVSEAARMDDATLQTPFIVLTEEMCI